MLTLKNIMNEMKDVPVNRLEELFQLVHSLALQSKPSATSRKKILSYGGAFSDLDSEEYTDFIERTKETRKQLLNRSIDL
jgi:hypothetical protein